MVAELVVLCSFSDNFGQNIKRVCAKVSTGFSNDMVIQRIILCDFDSFNGLLGDLSCGESSSNVQNPHLMAILTTDFDALSRIENCSFKS
jgi:hypothetical protein